EVPRNDAGTSPATVKASGVPGARSPIAHSCCALHDMPSGAVTSPSTTPVASNDTTTPRAVEGPSLTSSAVQPIDWPASTLAPVADIVTETSASATTAAFDVALLLALVGSDVSDATSTALVISSVAWPWSTVPVACKV